MKKRIIVIVIAVIAIALIAYFGVGRKVVDKYTYGTDMADLTEFYGVSGNELAIIVGNTQIGYKAIYENDMCYLPLLMIEEYFGEGFFYDPDYNGGTLMYTDAEGTYEVVNGATYYTYNTADRDLSYPITLTDNGNLYVAADFAKFFYTFTDDVYDYHVQINTEWGSHTQMEVTANTQIRVKGGIKSEILREVSKGETVELLEEMEEWSKVKTSDSYIGYIENKKMKNQGDVTEVPAMSPTTTEYESFLLDEKVCLGFHSIGGVGGNDTIYEMMQEGQGMNVIAPTWFSMNDNEGGIRNFGSTDYINIAHDNGLLVWGVLDNFNYENETGDEISDIAVLGSTVYRRNLENNIVQAAKDLGLDGINLDFEGLDTECGPYYAQFLKELSLLTHKAEITLSVDDYVPFNYNEHYHLDVQGDVADYVIIMGYDEHYHGSGDPGSVASFDYVANGLDRAMEDVPAEKLVNALPFYTIVWKVDGTTVTDSYLTLNNEAAYIAKLGISYTWDETTCQNYAEWKSGDATYMLWLEDEDSIGSKLNAMNSRNIGGVAVWRLGYGTESVWNLVRLYAEN